MATPCVSQQPSLGEQAIKAGVGCVPPAGGGDGKRARVRVSLSGDQN